MNFLKSKSQSKKQLQTLDKIHSVYQKVYQFNDEQCLKAVILCQKNMKKTMQLVNKLESEKLSTSGVKINYLDILQKNKEIIEDASQQLEKWLSLIYANILYHSQDQQLISMFPELTEQFFSPDQEQERSENVLKTNQELSKIKLNEKSSIFDEEEKNDVNNMSGHLLIDNIEQNSLMIEKLEDEMDDQGFLSMNEVVVNKKSPHKQKRQSIELSFKANLIEWAKTKVSQSKKKNLSKQSSKSDLLEEPKLASPLLLVEQNEQEIDGELEQKEAQEEEESEDQRIHREMLQRMERIYLDHSYENEETIAEYWNFKKKINRNSSTLVLFCINKLFQIIHAYADQLLNDTIALDAKTIRRFFVHCSKIYISHLILYVAMQASDDDIFYKNEDDIDWQILRQHYELIEMSDEQQVIGNYKNLYSQVQLGNAFVSKSYVHQSKFKKLFSTGVYATYYFFFKKSRADQNDFFCTNPDLDLAREIWNLLDSPIIKQMYHKTFPKVNVKGKFYIPFEDTEITIENISTLSQSSSLGMETNPVPRKTSNQNIQLGEQFESTKQKGLLTPKAENYLNDFSKQIVEEQKENQENLFTETKNQSNKNFSFTFHSKDYEHNPNTHVKVRIISATDLDIDFKKGIHHKFQEEQEKFQEYSSTPSASEQAFKQQEQQGFAQAWLSMLCCVPTYFPKMKREIKKKKRFSAKALILHIHGGGFISGSSSSHQNYTRIWANDTNIPIFSIDYRLSPKYQFPSALNDAWQTYYFLVKNAKHQFNIDPKKIILVGDSAGGNLIAALTVMAITRGFRVPDGLILCYPALNLSKSYFTPSLLLSLDDPILPYPFLKLCLDSYIGDIADANHPYISPGLASDQILKQFPKTRIMIANNDPLRDEGYKFTLRLAKLGVDVKIKEFHLLPHGFLSYNFPIYGMKEESMSGIKLGSQWIMELLEEKQDLQNSEFNSNLIIQNDYIKEGGLEQKTSSDLFE